jgi:hypothetical protein
VASEEHFGLPIIAFANAASLEGWLGAQPADSKGLWIKFAKKSLQIDTVKKPRRSTQRSATVGSIPHPTPRGNRSVRLLTQSARILQRQQQSRDTDDRGSTLFTRAIEP